MDFSIFCVKSNDPAIKEYPVLSKYKHRIEKSSRFEVSHINIETLPELIELMKDIGQDLIIARSDENTSLTIYDDYIE